MIDRRRCDRLTVRRPCRSALQVERIGHNPRVRPVSLHHVQTRLPVLSDRERDVFVHRKRLPGRLRLALPDHSTTPCPFRSPASRYSRSCRSWKHTEDNLDPIAGKTLCWSSGKFEPPPAPRRVNQRSASATALSSDLRVWQRDGDHPRWPLATCTGQRRRSTGGECDARRPRCRATAPNHRYR